MHLILQAFHVWPSKCNLSGHVLRRLWFNMINLQVFFGHTRPTDVSWTPLWISTSPKKFINELWKLQNFHCFLAKTWRKKSSKIDRRSYFLVFFQNFLEFSLHCIINYLSWFSLGCGPRYVLRGAEQLPPSP